MVNNSDTKVSYRGNGQTTVFPFTFPFIKGEYIHAAIYDETTKETVALTSDYYVDTVARTVTYPGYPPGQEPAEALRPPILPTTKFITIYRQTDVDQLTDLGTKYPLPQIESMSDKLTEILQEQKETLDRAVKVAIGDPEAPEQKWLDMQTYVSETSASATAAANSATAAATSETNAANSAAAAANSARAAALSEQSAAANQTTALNAAGNAEAAATAANEAVQSATNAMATTAGNVAECERIVGTLAAYDVPAWNADNVYSYPDVVAYTDGQTYRCIGENVPAGTAPRHSTAWVPLTVRGGDDFFEIDMGGNIQSREYPTVSATFELDSDGNIMPRATDDESVAIANTAAETYASQARTSATNAANSASAANNSAIAAAASAATATAAVELDADGNVTSTDNGL